MVAEITNLQNHNNENYEAINNHQETLSPEEKSSIYKKINHLKSSISTNSERQEQKIKELVEALESQLGVKAPASMQDAQKLDWLTTALKERDVKEQVQILKNLDEKCSGQQPKELENLKKEVISDAKEKKNTGDKRIQEDLETMEKELSSIDIDHKSALKFLDDNDKDFTSTLISNDKKKSAKLA